MGSIIPVGGGGGGAFQVTATADGAITAGDNLERSASGTARKKLGNYPLYLGDIFNTTYGVRFFECTEFDMTIAVGLNPSQYPKIVLMNHAWEVIDAHVYSTANATPFFDVAYNPATSSGVIGASGSNNHFHMHFHISAADTITPGTPTSAISIGGSTGAAYVACAHVAADKAVFAVGNSWGHTQELRCACVQFDDTGITSTGAWISAGTGIGTGAYAIAGDTTNGQVGVICYGLNSGSYRRQYINVLTVSGVTLTAGTPVTLIAAETYVGGVGIAYHAADDLWYMVTYNNSTAKTICHILQESGGSFSISGSLTDDTVSLSGGESTCRFLIYNPVDETVYALDGSQQVYSLPSPGTAGTTSLTLVGTLPNSTAYDGDGQSRYPSVAIGDRWWNLFASYGNLHVGGHIRADTIKGQLAVCIDLANVVFKGDGEFAGVADANAADAATVTINSGYLAAWVTFTAGDLLSVGGDNLPAVTSDPTRIHGVAIDGTSSLVLTVDGAGLLKSEE